ncbi:MAG: hypothetical protein LIQ30_01085 [Planctomycetes bacterium]|nr:hypothetical protein [Planctomycetota bacterium]
MRNTPILQAACAVLLVLHLAAGRTGAGQPPAMTSRQQDILRELEAFRPAGQGGDGGVWMISRWDTDAGLAGLVDLPTGPGNAAARFQLLEEVYREEQGILESGGEQSRGVELLLEAADIARSSLTPEYYPAFTSVDAKQPDFSVFRQYLQALLRRAETAAAGGDSAEAERCYRAAMVCGWHLTTDRSSSIVFVTGLIFKMRAAQGMTSLFLRTGDSRRLGLARAYSDSLSGIMRAFVWKANIALGEMDGFACLPAVCLVALQDAEPFWRKEAVVRLATLRYGLPDSGGTLVRRHPGWERVADEALSRVFNTDEDATVRQFALWAAQNVRPENYAAMRHDFSGME